MIAVEIGFVVKIGIVVEIAEMIGGQCAVHPMSALLAYMPEFLDSILMSPYV